MTSPREKIADASPLAESVVPRKILCVGIACLDIIQTCRQFPLEDSIGSVLDYRWQRGGNASNTCTVLSLLGQPCELLACLSADEQGLFLQNDLRKYKIDHRHCPIVSMSCGCPTSTVILSLSTGTRTILHHKANMRELTSKEFHPVNLEEYSWIHFEGRNLDGVLPMIRRVEDYNNSMKGQSAKSRVPITISVELERPRSELFELLPHADVAFVSKEFARSQGLNDVDEAVREIGRKAESRTTVICAWAEEGATARTANGATVRTPAFPPREVIDTLGAGDTFIAAALYYLNKRKVDLANEYNRIKNESDDGSAVKLDIKRDLNTDSLRYSRARVIDERVLRNVITFACRIAGTKVGSRGYDDLDKTCTDILMNTSMD